MLTKIAARASAEDAPARLVRPFRALRDRLDGCTYT